MDKFLIPKDGLIVRDPLSMAPLPPKGMLKPFIGSAGRYWRRRVNCGDVTIKEEIINKPKQRKVEEKGGKY